jgi:hypothetical protein
VDLAALAVVPADPERAAEARVCIVEASLTQLGMSQPVDEPAPARRFGS